MIVLYSCNFHAYVSINHEKFKFQSSNYICIFIKQIRSTNHENLRSQRDHLGFNVPRFSRQNLGAGSFQMELSEEQRGSLALFREAKGIKKKKRKVGKFGGTPPELGEWLSNVNNVMYVVSMYMEIYIYRHSMYICYIYIYIRTLYYFQWILFACGCIHLFVYNMFKTTAVRGFMIIPYQSTLGVDRSWEM